METLLSALWNVTKELVKVGIVVYDSVADGVAHATEGVKDLAAEARAELNVAPDKAAAHTASEPAETPGSVTDTLPTAIDVASGASGIPLPPVD
ncbi:MAG TPA: hypothetical protein VJV04_11295 [Nitrospiraceae bacterium]|nr:hypothetical protein [Nitrospiraceae bacterium]